MITGVIMGFKHQAEEKQIQSSTPASENKTSGPGSPRVSIVMASGNDKVVRVLNPPSQHARVAVTRAVKVGKFENTRKDDPEGVATRDKYRQSTQESGETLSHRDGIEARAPMVIAVLRLGVMCEVAGQ